MSEQSNQPRCPRCAELEAEVASLKARVAELEQIVAEQNKRIAELLERLNKTSANSSKPPSSNPPGFKQAPTKKRSGKKRGGQRGRQRALRDLVPPEKVSQVVDHFPSDCDHCGKLLEPGMAPSVAAPVLHQVAEIPPIEPHVTEHRLHECLCNRCGERTRAKLPGDVPQGQFGPRLTAILALLSGGYRVSKRGVQRLALDLFGLSISTGMVCKLQRRTAEALEKPVAALLEHVKTQNVHIDETSWREAGRKAWLWVVVTPLVTIFRIAQSRSADVARELLGSEYKHIAVCDRYVGYLWVNNVQLCWAHVRRDFQAMVDRGGESRAIGEHLLGLSDALFEWWHRVRDGTLARSTFQQYVSVLRKECRKQLELGTQCGCARTAGTCRELLLDERYLWTFVRREGIEPTNNAAERSLRHAVLWRKSSYGTASKTGSRFVERILSLTATCRQQGRDVLETLTSAIEAHQLAKPTQSLLPQPDHPSAAA